MTGLQAGCAAISEADGRWRAMDCTLVLPTACRFLDGSWLLWPGEKGRCPNGSAFEVPHTAKENVALQSTLHLSPLGVASAWLPIFGDEPSPSVGYGKQYISTATTLFSSLFRCFEFATFRSHCFTSSRLQVLNCLCNGTCTQPSFLCWLCLLCKTTCLALAHLLVGRLSGLFLSPVGMV